MGYSHFVKFMKNGVQKKKAKQVEDITKKERFDVTLDMPLKISK